MPTIVEAHIQAYKYRTDGWGYTNKQAMERLAKGIFTVLFKSHFLGSHTFLNSGNKETSGNGVIMKLCPLAMYYACKKTEKDQIIREVSLLTSMTHDTPVCKIASCLFVLFAEKIFWFALFFASFAYLKVTHGQILFLCCFHKNHVKNWLWKQ
jgi:ADP-ribosylglycohydrolase